ncbi:MAG: ABC transporter permease subunit [Clostridiales bacterium]|jgi:sodium transport system permease protein|nr:ABC transporter permease subunit [Clostridiales bacterium]
MNKNILAVMKKEFARFFRDPRMVLTAMVLPGLMIYLMYVFMGSALQDILVPDDAHVPVLNAVNIPADIKTLAEAYGFTVNGAEDADAVKAQIAAKENDILVIFGSGFTERAEAHDPASGEDAPNVEIYYNATNPNSDAAYDLAARMLKEYEDSLANRFDVNRDIEANLASREDMMAFSFSSMLPFLLLTFMFTSCMSLATESIAGEKERGTIATILITPIKRGELAIGKILSLGVLAFLCGCSSAVGTFLSLPQMMSVSDESMNIYAPADYAVILLVILSAVLLIVTVISIISAFSKTVKEANTSVMPLMIVVMLAGITSMFGGKTQTEPAVYLIPLYNSVQAMSAVLKFDYNMTHILLTIISNVVYACAGGFVLTRMFNSERVIFSR